MIYKDLTDLKKNPLSKNLLASKYEHLIGKRAVLKNFNNSCNRCLMARQESLKLFMGIYFYDVKGTGQELREGVYLNSLNNFDLIG